MKPRLLFLFAVFVPAVVSAQGLSGSLEGIGAYNFKESNRENLNFRLDYDSPVWYVHSSLGGEHDYSPTEVAKLSANGKKWFWDSIDEYTDEALIQYLSRDIITKFTWEDKNTCKRIWTGKVGVDAGVHIGKADHIKGKINYLYSASMDRPDIYNERFSSEEHSTVIDMQSGRQLDIIDFDRGRLDGNLEYTHDFAAPGRRLSASFTTLMCFDSEDRDRMLKNEKGIFYKDPKRYRTPSQLNDINWAAAVRYADDNLLGIRKLKGNVGVDVIQNNDVDFYKRLDYINGGWKEDKDFYQGYLYASLAVEPVVKLDYSIGNFDISVLQRLQIYKHRLASHVDEGLRRVDLKDVKSHLAEILDVDLAYRFNERNKLSLEYGRDIVRPDYLKLTDMIKTGNTENEYFVGNSDLMPQINNSLFLKYTYTFQRYFEFYASAQYRNMRDKAEKVVDNRKDDITYYTYVNAGLQQTVSLRLDVRANYERLKAELYLQTNDEFIDYMNIKKDSKRTFNVEIMANASYAFNKGWSVSARGGYATMKESAYNAKDAYVQTDVRITKSFEKVDLYLEGRDLTDRIQKEYTWNESLDYCKITYSALFRRAVVLGLKYRF